MPQKLRLSKLIESGKTEVHHFELIKISDS